MEPEFWVVLDAAARGRGISLSALVATIDADRDAARPLASALRVFALRTSAARCNEADK